MSVTEVCYLPRCYLSSLPLGMTMHFREREAMEIFFGVFLSNNTIYFKVSWLIFLSFHFFFEKNTRIPVDVSNFFPEQKNDLSQNKP